MKQNDNISHAFNVATKKKQNRMTIHMGMAQLDFKHEFTATDLDTWGQEIDTHDNPK